MATGAGSTPLRFLWQAALRRPWWVVGIACVAVPWLALAARNLRLEASIDLLSPKDPLAVADRERREIFGEDFRILLGLFKSEHEGGVLGRPSRDALVDLHRALEALPGVEAVSSLVNARALVASADTPAGAPLWPPPEPAELRRRLGASELQQRLLLSPHASLTPLLVEISGKVSEAELTRGIRRLAAEVETRHPEGGDVLVVGPAVVETGLAEHVFDDLHRLVPFAVGVIVLGLLVVCRRPIFLCLAVVHSLVLLAVVLGAMAACGVSVNLVSVLAPVILIPIGVADLLHLFIRLDSVTAHGGDADPGPALAAAFTDLEGPMVGTSLTTAIGFLGFLISPVAAIRQFGLTLSAGAIVALVVTLTLDAALLALCWRPRSESPGSRSVRKLSATRFRSLASTEGWQGQGLRKLVRALRVAWFPRTSPTSTPCPCFCPGKQGQTSIRTATETPDGVANGTRHFRRRLPLPPIEGAPDPSRPIPPRRASLIERWLLGQTTVAELRYRSRLALAIGAVLAAAGLASLTQLEIEDTWIRNFDPQSPVARDTERFEEEFLGTNVLAVVIAADPAVPGARARALDQINRLSTSLTVAPGLRGVLSATLLARSLDPRQGQPWRKWPTPSVARMREDRVTWNRRGLVLPRMRTLADSDLNRFQVLVFVLNQRYRDLLRRAGITAALAEEPAGAGVRVRVGGNLALNLRMVRLAVSAQAYSLIAVLAAIALLVVGFTRSLSSGMALLLPMVLAILMTFFILVGLGLPYGIAVSMFPTLVVGLALDFAIHLRAALVRNRSASRTRWARNLAVTVRGIVFNGAVWSAGFAVLIVSDLPPNRYLGLLCSVVVGLSTAATLLMLPAIALRIGRSPTSLA